MKNKGEDLEIAIQINMLELSRWIREFERIINCKLTEDERDKLLDWVEEVCDEGD